MKLSIKEHPELRHALAHMCYAIEALARGARKEARYELDSVESLIFWENDKHMTRSVEMKSCKGKKKNCKGKRK